MSYYNPNPNVYYNTANQYGTAEPRFNQMQSQFQGGMQQLPQSYLNGKFVESSDIVKVTDVPFSGYGVFPKLDLSEVYIKSWNPNGTTSIVTYKPIVTKEPEEVNAEIINTILQRVKDLEIKMNDLSGNAAAANTDNAPRKEVQF